jgi:hypothetical protein
MSYSVPVGEGEAEAGDDEDNEDDDDASQVDWVQVQSAAYMLPYVLGDNLLFLIAQSFFI